MLFENLIYLSGLYDQYKRDPLSLPATLQSFFEGFTIAQGLEGEERESRGARIAHLIDAYRVYGHLKADINPLLPPPKEVAELNLESMGFKKGEMEELFPTLGLLEEKEAPLKEIIARLERVYAGRMGIEYKSCQNPHLEEWLEKRIEGLIPPFSRERKREIFRHLISATFFENYLHTKYVGQKRFSLEGAESLIPIVKAVIEVGSDLGMEELVIGMSHRGRLNVLSNVLNKSYADIFSEFEDFYDPTVTEGAGDVKYHKGYSVDVSSRKGKNLHISLTANPSHLESVDPVVEGKVRAKQDQSGDLQRKRVWPLLVHGDAALAGQGVVYECMQLYGLEGYKTGGTLHIVVNNQIGFTTLPQDSRSTRYATDIAKAFSAPVIHVNGEDVEACLLAAEIACEIKEKFGCDVFIDLYCYRKYGHNEGDEPSFTQPRLYALIRQKKSLLDIYKELLLQEMQEEELLQIEREVEEKLQRASKEKKEYVKEEGFKGIWHGFRPATLIDLFTPVHTALSQEKLMQLAKKVSSVPEGFNLHPKLAKLFQEREEIVERGVDWAFAETLALASLLEEGARVRFTGQDSRRGTFSQRHGMVVDQKSAKAYFPLQHLHDKQGHMDLIDSPLSEFAALGFEFGYSLASPHALVVWEAQFGDFANGGQVMIDQYISSSEEKWHRFSALVLLLPHGYEGQGPEHSSARIERFLQLAGGENMEIIYPTTPAQYFHLLRRQHLREIRKPLVIFTPKSLLRHPECKSTLNEFTLGFFQQMIDDPHVVKEEVKRVLLCSGKIYYTLLAKRREWKKEEVAIVRIEELYPFHQERFGKILAGYPKGVELFWVQEEPKNMGAWSYISAFLPKETQYVGRARRASPATGSHKAHVREEEKIMNKAFEI